MLTKPSSTVDWPLPLRARALFYNKGVRKTFKYRLYPNKQQQRLLEAQLEECHWLYNELLATRRDAWEQRQESLRLYDQQATLPALKAAWPALAKVQSQVLQNVAVRVDLAFQAFFRRVKAGEKPGYPRFRGAGRYDSLTYPQAPVGCKLDAEARRVQLAWRGPGQNHSVSAPGRHAQDGHHQSQ